MYRDDQQAARLQLHDLDLPRAPMSLRRLWARRLGWIAAGLTGVAGAAAFAMAIPLTFLAGLPAHETLPVLLLGCWPLAAIAGLATAGVARLRPPRPSQPNSGNALTMLAVRHTDRDHGSLRRRIGRLGFASTVLPVLALCLLSPLTVHVVVFLTLWPDATLEAASGWIAVSAIVTWLPHGVVCYAAVGHCRRLSRGESPSAWASLGHLGLAAAAVVPCSLLFGLVLMASVGGAAGGGILLTSIFMSVAAAPLVFVTGLAFLPATYRQARRRLERERAELAP